MDGMQNARFCSSTGYILLFQFRVLEPMEAMLPPGRSPCSARSGQEPLRWSLDAAEPSAPSTPSVSRWEATEEASVRSLPEPTTCCMCSVEWRIQQAVWRTSERMSVSARGLAMHGLAARNAQASCMQCRRRGLGLLGIMTPLSTFWRG